MFHWLRVVTFLLGSFIFLTAQDIDSVPSLQKRNLASIADEIADPAERSAFLQLFKPAAPAEMRERAEAFLARFPQSAFLAQAYEVGARGCFGLGEYELGLSYAQTSLALLPENPLLLVPVADVEARQNLNSAAIAHAREALDDLDRFAGPSSVRDEDWPKVRQQLKSTANFAKGRALLQTALRQPAGDSRQELLKKSEASLLEALHFNNQDLEIAYVLGLAQLSFGKAMEAGNSFAAVYRGGSELAPKALDNLRTIHRLLSSSATISFENFLQQATDRWTTGLQNSNKATDKKSRTEPTAMAYLGSDSCRGCHGETYKGWSESGMAKMLRPYAPQNVVGDFQNNNEFYLGDETDYRDGKFEVKRTRDRRLFARMAVRQNRHYFDILQSDGKWHSYPVDYTIGSKFEQAYATKLPNGEIHVFPIQYNVLHKQWINFWKVIDGPGSERGDPRTWERLDASTSYQAICAVCHTSQLRNVKGAGFNVNNVEFKEPGIDCEMCHGPSGGHVIDMSEHDYHPKEPLDPPVNFHKIDSRKSVAICAQCHMQSAIRSSGPDGELNYVSSGEFFGNRLRQPFGEFFRKGFYKDGRFRQTTFIVEALERSQCFKKAELSCGTCHDPHSRDSASNPTSLKFRNAPDLMCTGCHSQFKDAGAIRGHSHHAPESEGSRCVSCHMPRIMDALLFRARYHQIDDIPNAEMTKRFGQEESPNACLLCHAEKNAGWVGEQLSGWKPLHASAPVKTSR
jgi:predicted CXXCH cytochrome family protein